MLDHIVPAAHAGENDWTNLTASCTRCNESKQARPLLSYLLHRTRPLTLGELIRRRFGENVRARRRALGLTQRQFAERIDTDAFQVSRWERGVVRPTDVTLARLAEALGVEFAWFFTDHGTRAAA